MTITEETVRAQSKQSSRIWLKKLTSLHDRIAEQLDDVLNGRKVIAEWMTLGKKIVEFKDPGNGVDNYRPIPCLPFMWNLSTGGVVSESMYNFLIKNNFLPEEQRGCRKGS